MSIVANTKLGKAKLLVGYGYNPDYLYPIVDIKDGFVTLKTGSYVKPTTKVVPLSDVKLISETMLKIRRLISGPYMVWYRFQHWMRFTVWYWITFTWGKHVQSKKLCSECQHSNGEHTWWNGQVYCDRQCGCGYHCGR